MILYHITIFLIKTRSFISINQTSNNNFANRGVYKRLIKKLIYLTYGTQPNIPFVVGLSSQYNSYLRVGYFCIAKQELYYLIETINLEIV